MHLVCLLTQGKMAMSEMNPEAARAWEKVCVCVCVRERETDGDRDRDRDREREELLELLE